MGKQLKTMKFAISCIKLTELKHTIDDVPDVAELRGVQNDGDDGGDGSLA